MQYSREGDVQAITHGSRLIRFQPNKGGNAPADTASGDYESVQTIIDQTDIVRLNGEPLSRRDRYIAAQFLQFTKRHPCLGARSVGAIGNLFCGVYDDMDTVESAWEFVRDTALYYRLSDTDYHPIRTDPDGAVIKSFGAIFVQPVDSQDDFAEQYWKFAQIVHDIDPEVWDPSVKSDPSDPGFEMSIAGRAVFTTTLNPESPRTARAFSYPTWVMNQLRQFNALRERPGRAGFENEFERWKSVIRRLDSESDPSGRPNPVLTDHGTASAFDQLAGSAPKSAQFVARAGTQNQRSALRRRIQQAHDEQASRACISALTDQLIRL